MKDPYEILGVSPTASEEEVKRAHQEIVEKYHPENHPDNPLAHLAREKIEEANAAYDEIIRMRHSATTGASQHLDIRRLIGANRVSEAEELLEGVPEYQRDAEWYFLKGTIQHSRGWLEEAYINFSKAVQMNPQNAEYRATLSQLQWQRQTGQPAGNYNQQPSPPVVSGCSVCDMCATMYCANCCCQCLGGGCR